MLCCGCRLQTKHQIKVNMFRLSLLTLLLVRRLKLPPWQALTLIDNCDICHKLLVRGAYGLETAGRRSMRWIEVETLLINVNMLGRK